MLDPDAECMVKFWRTTLSLVSEIDPIVIRSLGELVTFVAKTCAWKSQYPGFVVTGRERVPDRRIHGDGLGGPSGSRGPGEGCS
jgi:hypothetical protein